MREMFKKLNDYTLIHRIDAPEEELDGYHRNLKINTRITRTFNFLSAQLTTTTRDMTYESRGGDAGGSSSVSTQTIIENFDSIQSKAEIRLMHAELQKQNGKPPPLEEVLSGGFVKKAPLTATRN